MRRSASRLSIVSSIFVVQFWRIWKGSEIHFPDSFDRPLGWPKSKCHVKSTKQSKAQQETKTEGKLCISGPVGPDCTLLQSSAVPLTAGRSACCSPCCRAAAHCSFCSISRPGSVFSPRPVLGPTVPGRKISNFFAGFLDSSLLTKIYVAVLWVISAHRATRSGVNRATKFIFLGHL